MTETLPPGQRMRSDFPRFGLSQYADRFPKHLDIGCLTLSGDALDPWSIDDPLSGLDRVEQTCDFHCVTTWSHRNLRWGGVRFAQFYKQKIAPKLTAGVEPKTVLLRAQDGYRTTLPLLDLLAADVLLADMLDGNPLTVEHGAPIRLVAPSHYGYKCVKHLSGIELWHGVPKVKPAALAFMDHPRARVALEERGRWFPGWLLRLAYRPLIKSTVARFEKAMASRKSSAVRPLE